MYISSRRAVFSISLSESCWNICLISLNSFWLPSVSDEAATVIMLICLLKKNKKVKANTELSQTKILLKMCLRKMTATRGLIHDFWNETMPQPSAVYWVLILTCACHFRDLRNSDANMVTKRKGLVREVYTLNGVWQEQKHVKGLSLCPHFARWCGNLSGAARSVCAAKCFRRLIFLLP